MSLGNGVAPAGLYFHDAACLADTSDSRCPWGMEGAERLRAVEGHLAALDWLGWEPREAGPALESELELVHSAEYIARVRELAEAGGGSLEGDAWVAQDSFQIAKHAAGATLAMTRALACGEAGSAFAAVRPPGHHAGRDRAMGFCLFNNVAIAAELAIRELGFERVFILDWDAHHGNGTNELFRERADVLFASIHGSGSFPGTGQPHDVGTGPGEGYSINVPVPRDADGAVWLSRLDELVIPAAAEFAPQLVLVSAGYGAHFADPRGHGRLRTATFAAMAARIADFASARGIPVGAVLEGGYEPPVLAECVRETMRALAQRPDRGAAASVQLRDGRCVTVREALPADERAIGEFLAGLCLEARRLRFFTGGVDVPRMTSMITSSGPDRLGLVAEDESGTMVGHAICIDAGDARAEVALEVADALHGEGLGTVLVERLAELAERRGIATLMAEVLPENRAMLAVLRDGFDAHVKWSDGVDEVEFPAASWRLARQRFNSMFTGDALASERAPAPAIALDARAAAARES